MPRLPTLLPVLLLAALLGACSRETPPGTVALAFWDNAQTFDEEGLLAVVATPDPAAVASALERLQPADASIELGEAVIDGKNAQVPTTLVRGEEFAQYEVRMATYLVQRDGNWKVALAPTMDSYREAVANAVGVELRQAAERVRDVIGAGGRELGAALEQSMREAREDLQASGSQFSEEMADQLGEALEGMGTDLARELNELAATLEQELAELEASGEMEELDDETLAEIEALARELEREAEGMGGMPPDEP